MTVQVAARVEPKVKEAASKVVAEFGLDLSTTIKMFITRIAKEQRIPMDISKPAFSLNGDEFKNDTEYFKQIPGYWESIVEASKEPLDNLAPAKESGWNV
jgi:DNA-damage-inducible protein J